MNILIHNKKAEFNYILEDTFVAGIVLEGWEVKSILAKKVNMDNAYVLIKNNEVWLLNLLIQPRNEVSTHVIPEPTRTRKLLLHRSEINRLIGKTEVKGYTLIPVNIIKDKKIKIEFALAKGKKEFDKRNSIKDKDWLRDQQKLIKSNKLTIK